MTIRIAIAGASGYAGGEVARFVSAHPHFELGVLTAHNSVGKAVIERHPHLRSLGERKFVATSVENLVDHDVVILALPHGQSGDLGEALAKAKPELTIVDLGADRRLEDSSAWEAFYGGEYFSPWVYGIPELPHADGTRQRDSLVGATRIVAPGCNASAVAIPLAPLVRDGLVDLGSLVSTLSVGTSGAGRTLREDLLASERFSSATAYGVAGTHRHTPEIIQTLGKAGALIGDIRLSLNPVLVPMSRGIIAVTVAGVKDGVDEARLQASLKAAYGDEPFIRLSPRESLPSTGSVHGSNIVAMSVALDPATRRLTLVSVLDNLVKGTAGAAIQSLNVAVGLDETLGLPMDGVAP